MSIELIYLTAVTLFTALIWIPYTVNMILVRGLVDAFGYPENPKPLAPWAVRMCSAHTNAVENLVVFAPLVLVAHALGVSNDTTVMASMIYVWARVAHWAVYTAKIPVARTLAFVVGSVCQVIIAIEILS